jgi:hypothetical protein
MPQYLISFDSGSMDHVTDAEPAVAGTETHAVVDDAQRAGVWVFRCCIEATVGLRMSTPGWISNRADRAAVACRRLQAVSAGRFFVGPVEKSMRYACGSAVSGPAA